MVAISSFLEPPERIRHQQNNTTVFVNDNNIGKGTLYIAESNLSWCSETGNGFSLEYPHICLHAISRDLTAFPHECIFMMLDADFTCDGENHDLEDDSSDEQVTTELRVIPDDKGMLDAMFHALNICQALHPDPQDSFSDEDISEDGDDIDDDNYVSETDPQMADLRIRNMGERVHMVGGRVEEDMVEDMEEDRVGGILEDNKAENMGENISWDNRVGDRVVDTLEDNKVEEGHILEGKEEDMEVGILEDKVKDMGVGISVGRVGGILVDKVEDTEEDMVVGRVGGISVDTDQDGRSFFSDNMWHQNRKVCSPQGHSQHKDPECSNFDDAEN